jgi:hypothetical protein
VNKKLRKFNLALLFPISALACDGYVVGFKGLNDAFDTPAFAQYVNKTGYCAQAYSWNDSTAKVFIQTLSVPYQLYGFSKGAETISKLLNTDIKRPEYIITIGAYRTVDVNFDKYNIPYTNYFDHSGIGQRSRGIFLNVPHMQMQQQVNKIHGR